MMLYTVRYYRLLGTGVEGVAGQAEEAVHVASGQHVAVQELHCEATATATVQTSKERETR